MQPMINMAGPDCVCLITQARTVTLRTGIDAAYRSSTGIDSMQPTESSRHRRRRCWYRCRLIIDDRLTDLNRAPQSGVLHASSSPSLSANMYNISLQSTAIHQYVNTISTISEPPPSTIRTPTSHPSLPRRVIHSTTCDTISLMSNSPPASSRHMEAMMAARCAWNSRSSSKPSSSNARNTPSLFLGPDAPASSHSPAHPALPASPRTRFAPT